MILNFYYSINKNFFLSRNINGDFMAKKDNKMDMPQTGAGLVRYFDEESVGPKLSPQQVVVVTVVLAIFCFILRYSS